MRPSPSSSKHLTMQRWGLFSLVSLIFFQISGATFMSLGVVLPYMVEELSWSWENAGIGFALLGLLTGVCSYVPAWTIRKFGIKSTYGMGGFVMILGFALMASTQSLYQYFLATCLLGLGFSSCATVPAMFVINSWFPDKRSFVIGAYLTMGGLGGVPGPLIANAFASGESSWRLHWWAMGASLLVLTLLALVFVRLAPDEVSQIESEAENRSKRDSDRVFHTSVDWRLREVLRTPQFFVMIAALTVVLLCTTTANAFAPAHMGILGVSASVAAGALSGHSLVNAFSRLFGGVMARSVDPKWLLVSALFAEIIAMLTLSVADNAVVITLFAITEGYAFGMGYLAVVILVVNYFGREHNPEILGTVHLFTTIATLGPWIAGMVGDRIGSFGILFQVFAVLVFFTLVATVMMRPPRHLTTD